MESIEQIPFYDPNKSYEDNYRAGPFGELARPGRFAPTGQPRQRFLNFPVHLPFGIPAGPLLNANFVRAALRHGFSLCTYKTVRSRRHPSHPWPNVLAVHPSGDLPVDGPPLVADRDYQAPLSITNSFGVPSADPDIWQPDLQRAVAAAGPGQVVIGSFQGTPDGSAKHYLDDFVLAARLVKETGARVLEANLSCPNEGTSHLLCFDLARTAQITRAIKEEIGDTPLIIKLAYFADNRQLAKLARAINGVVDGVSAINTIGATIVNEKGKPALPGEGRERSGVCGSAIRWAGIDMVQRLDKLRAQLGANWTIIGVGGVQSPDDYAAYRKAGADAVMSATGAMWNPRLAEEIWREENHGL